MNKSRLLMYSEWRISMPTINQLVILFLASLFTLVGCGYIKGGATFVGAPTALSIDFLKTQIVAGSATPADGTTPLVVVMTLKNADDSLVTSYLPTYSVTPASGVVAGACTTSDINGLSVCVLKSTASGIKTLTLTNALTGLTKAVVFSTPSVTQDLALLSAMNVHATTSLGSVKATISLGDPLHGATLTSGSYKITFSLQGTAL